MSFIYGYAIRLQDCEGYSTMFDTVFNEERFSKIIGAHHMGKKRDNPHFHFVCQTDYKSDAIRKYLKKNFDKGRGNKHISIKAWDGSSRACSYLFHEDTEEIICRGFSEEEVLNFKNLNSEIKQELKEKSGGKLIQDCIEHFQTKKKFKPNTREIFDFIMDRLREQGGWFPNKFQFERWVMKVQAGWAANSEEWRDVKQEWFESWYGSFSY